MEGELARPVRPDHAEVKAQTMKLAATMEKYAARIEEIKELTANRKGARAPISEKERALRKELNDTRGSFQSALRQKQSIRDELNKANQGREQLRLKLRQMKENTKFNSVEEIDLQIKRLEEKINKTELTEDEQDDAVTQIRQLVRSREKVRSLRKQLDSIQSDDNPCEDLMDRLKDVDAELDKWKLKEKELRKELDAMKKEREEEEMDISALISEKQECWQVLCALKEKKKEINDAFTERMNAFKKQETEYRIQKKKQEKKMEEERRAQREKEAEEKVLVRPRVKETVKEVRADERPSKEEEEAARKERERKQAERRQRQIDYQRRYQEEKIAKCDYLMAYLTPLMPSSKQETTEPKTEITTVVQGWSPSEAGMKELKKSQPEERDAWLMGNKGKKSKNKKSKKSTKIEKPEDKILMHSLPTLQAFRELNIQIPDTMADVLATLQALEQHKEHYRTHHTDPQPSKSKSSISDEQPHTPDLETEVQQSTEATMHEVTPSDVTAEPPTEQDTEECMEEHPDVLTETEERDPMEERTPMTTSMDDVTVEADVTDVTEAVDAAQGMSSEHHLPQTLDDVYDVHGVMTEDVQEDDDQPETPPSMDTRLPLEASREIPSIEIPKIESKALSVHCHWTIEGMDIGLELKVIDAERSQEC